MKIVIVGDGKVGQALTGRLAEEGHDLVVIDSSPEALRTSVEVHDVMGISGNGASYAVQKEAGVEDADLLIAATSGDELNLLCCMVANKIGARHTIARVRNPDYADQLVMMKEEFGLSMAINPELAAATEIARMLRFPSALKLDSFARGMVELVEIKVKEDSPLLGQALFSLSSHLGIRILICAVKRGDEVYIPTGSFVLQQGDKITLTANPAQLDSLFRKLGIYRHKIHRVMVVGGGRIAYYLAKQLLKLGMSVKIIEKDAARCEQLSEALPKAQVILGDGSDRELLEEEDIDNMDALVAVTGMDEENIIISMYAGTLKLPKVVTKINRMSFQEILDSAGIESVISPKGITVNQIVRYVRAMQNSQGSNVETLHRIVGGRVEALEFSAGYCPGLTGIPLKDLRTRKNLLIACIIRGRQTIYPGGNDAIEEGDSVVVVTTEHQLKDLRDILEPA
ncbi:MAG: Trk system potassium transporter TrkA [Angelakisella sp.]|nr:Trk system potassium transporter TrkA [Angelakisella sp.]